MDNKGAERDRLLKKVPDTIPDLVAQLGKTSTSDEDQLVLTSLSIELNAAGLEWTDLAFLIRYQVVAHRIATLKGVINAAKAHPQKHRLSEWEAKFLSDLHRRGRLLTDRQIACLQSITDSLDMSDDEYALKVLAREPDILGMA